MKRIILSVASLLIAGTFLISSCKKKEDITPDNTSSTTTASIDDPNEQAIVTADNSNTQSHVDQALDDVNNLVSGGSGGREDGQELFCGMHIKDTLQLSSTVSGVGTKTISYTYDGSTSCKGKTRSGTIIVTLVNGKHFRDKGAMYTVSFTGYTIKANDSIVTLNGLHTVTNITGGLPRLLGWGGTNPVIHQIRSNNMQITFGNSGLTRDWNVARKMTYSLAASKYSITMEGDTTIGSLTGVVTWGTNRFGDGFTTQITTPISINSDCIKFGWIPASGKRVHTVTPAAGGSAIVVTEEIITGSDGCSSGYTISFTNRKGVAVTKTKNF